MNPLRGASDYPHFVALAAIVAVATLLAGYSAEKRRGRDSAAGSSVSGLFAGFVFALILVFIYCFFCYLLSAVVVASILWAIFGLPESTSEVVMAEAVAELATVFAVASNFADVASTFDRPRFWKHLRQYVVFGVPTYYATMTAAWIAAQGLAQVLRYEPGHATRAAMLFRPPTLTTVPLLNVLLFIGVFLAASPIAFWLRKRGERR